MADQGSTGDQGSGHEEVEKLLIQAETGGGRTAARPSAVMGIGGLAPSMDQPASLPLGGGPGGGATGDQPMPDTIGPSPAEGG